MMWRLRAFARRIRYRLVFAADRWLHRDLPRCTGFGGCNWHVGHQGPCDPIRKLPFVAVASDGNGHCSTLSQAMHLVEPGGTIQISPSHRSGNVTSTK